MGIHYAGIPVLAITIFILIIAPVSNSRNIHRITIEGNNQRFQPPHHSNSKHPWHTTTASAPKESWNNNADPITGVSKRETPGGPNPLHN
ncbi:hypothetical protein L2E82_06342 [Cichorium intybus]|uniref:Uncharacterized protein n=1 Tax=Cichorium intybus TaxID=13427 RepID=A0ACB9HBZ6_CICIN|nr:hypothetical protein L2E82_06342 [Cichorium intybus]